MIQVDAAKRLGKAFSMAAAIAALLGAAEVRASEPAAPAAGAEAPADITVQDRKLPIQVGSRTLALVARVFRPPGPGPFPVVVINHGTPVSMRDAADAKPGFTKAATWFAQQGYLTVVALRPGFGASQGDYAETSGPCDRRDYVSEGRATAALEAAIVGSAAALPGADAARIVVVGQSAGGFGAIALGDRPPPGVLGVISFAGGRGGDGQEHICSGVDSLVDAARVFGRANQTPQLWLFAANDHFFAPPVGRAMFAAYRAGSRPPMTFVDLPAFGDDGHKTLGRADPSVWAAPVLAFLKGIMPPAGGRPPG